MDAVFSWPLNGKTYLIRGQKYWRYDEVAARPDPGYPHALSLWEGVPFAPDDVTQVWGVLICKLWSLGEKKEGGKMERRSGRWGHPGNWDKKKGALALGQF